MATKDSDYLRRATLVAFDCETTGMWAGNHRIVELAGIKFSLSGRKVERFHSLINPQMKMPEEVIWVHGITDDIVADAPTADTVIPRFVEFCGTAILVAHNAPFDISFLTRELTRLELPPVNNPVLDTCELSRRYFPGVAGFSLLALAQHFQISETQEHRAMADAVLVKKLLGHIQKKLPVISSEEDLRILLSSKRVERRRFSSPVLPDSLSELRTAIEEKELLEITYWRPNGGQSQRIIEPKHTFEDRDLVYVSAFCHTALSERTFRLDRILACRLLQKK